MTAIVRRLAVALLSATLFVSPAIASAKAKTVTQAPVTAGSLQLFSTEAGAQTHCPKDVVVWLNTNSGIYHEKDARPVASTGRDDAVPVAFAGLVGAGAPAAAAAAPLIACRDNGGSR
jgi:hypothetical protein